MNDCLQESNFPSRGPRRCLPAPARRSGLGAGSAAARGCRQRTVCLRKQSDQRDIGRFRYIMKAAHSVPVTYSPPLAGPGLCDMPRAGGVFKSPAPNALSCLGGNLAPTPERPRHSGADLRLVPEGALILHDPAREYDPRSTANFLPGIFAPPPYRRLHPFNRDRARRGSPAARCSLIYPLRAGEKQGPHRRFAGCSGTAGAIGPYRFRQRIIIMHRSERRCSACARSASRFRKINCLQHPLYKTRHA